MNETLDIATLADELSAAGIHPSVTARLAEAVRGRGVAAVPSLGAFGSWVQMKQLNGLVGRGFDAGLDRQTFAAQLELAAQLQEVMAEVSMVMTERRTVGR